MSYSAESASEARGHGLALLLSLLSRDGATAGAAGWGPGRDSDDFLWQLMANCGEFQVDLFGDYWDGHALQVEKVR